MRLLYPNKRIWGGLGTIVIEMPGITGTGQRQEIGREGLQPFKGPRYQRCGSLSMLTPQRISGALNDLSPFTYHSDAISRP